MKISVTLGDVQIKEVTVRRHSGGIFTIQISTPLERHPGIVFGSVSETPEQNELGTEPYPSRMGMAQFIDLYPVTRTYGLNPTRVSLLAETNEEEEALAEGLFDLDSWSRWSVLLVAVPSGFFEEYEVSGVWSV